MALKIETTIRNIREVSAGDFGDEDDHEILKGLEDDEIPVTVDCLATDGYYDVTTPSGRVIAALSWYHLDGFNENGPECLQ